MTITSTKRCPSCGKLSIVVNSNNVLSPGICDECLASAIDVTDLKQADFFCRTYNIPFSPDTWIRVVADKPSNIFATYVKVVMEEYKDDLTYKHGRDNGQLWEKINNTWRRNMEFGEILEQVECVKEGWLAQMRAKWGNNFTFSEFLRLEEITNNTIKSIGATSALTLDTIRKLATTSIMIDKALAQGEVKEAAEYSKMYQTFIKSGGFEELLDVSTETGVISNVADLCNYLEERDFTFDYYNGVSKDIVDKTIEDIQNWTRRFVLDSAGIIQQEYEVISDAWKTKAENDKYNAAVNSLSLEEIIAQRKQGINDEDDGLDNEIFDFDGDTVDDEYKY